jgi:hypothetical protein
MSSIVAKHVVGQSITRGAAIYLIIIAAVVFGAATVNGSALVARRAACRWAEREIGSSLATAVVGWPYLRHSARVLRNLLPEGTESVTRANRTTTTARRAYI